MRESRFRPKPLLFAPMSTVTRCLLCVSDGGDKSVTDHVGHSMGYQPAIEHATSRVRRKTLTASLSEPSEGDHDSPFAIYLVEVVGLENPNRFRRLGSLAPQLTQPFTSKYLGALRLV